MKKLLLLILAGFSFSFVFQQEGISKKEKKQAAKFLKESEKEVLASIKDLSSSQLNFKPAPDKWSVEDCVKHIAAAEIALWQMADSGLKAPASPEKRAAIKMSDEELVKKIEDRSARYKTFPPLEPANTSYKSISEAISSFKYNRNNLVHYVKHTEADLRNHVMDLPFGSLDGYQVILFIGAHTNRHLQQINEIKADPAFPKQ